MFLIFFLDLNKKRIYDILLMHVSVSLVLNKIKPIAIVIGFTISFKPLYFPLLPHDCIPISIRL